MFSRAGDSATRAVRLETAACWGYATGAAGG